MAALGARSAAALALVVLGASACDERNGAARDAAWAAIGRTCPADAPAAPLDAARRDSLPPVESSNDHNARRAALARIVPGRFAGLASVGGRLTLALADTSRRAEALAFTRAHGIEGIGLTDDTPVLAARWDYAQLYDWLRYLQLRLDGVGGLVSLGVDEQNNRIEYGVVSTNDRLALEARLRQLGVPCFLVAIAIERRPSSTAGS